jgi:hypothetical protein
MRDSFKVVFYGTNYLLMVFCLILSVYYNLTGNIKIIKRFYNYIITSFSYIYSYTPSLYLEQGSHVIFLPFDKDASADLKTFLWQNLSRSGKI